MTVGLLQAGDAAVGWSVIGPDDRVPVGDTMLDPWRWIGQVRAAAEGGTYIGTAFLVGPFHVLTAGHVVHNAAYGGDGWATGVSVALGRAGTANPYGVAVAADVRAPAGWLTGGDPADDWALITLDRSLGAVLGGFRLGGPTSPAAVEGLTVTLAGYPGDLDGGRALHASWGQIGSATEDRLYYAGTLDTAGGMSGSPIWQTDPASGERVALGIHTSGTLDPEAEGATNGGVRLSAAEIAQIAEWIDADIALGGPADLPDPADADTALGTATAALAGALVPGGSGTLSVDIRNLGTAPADVSLTAYLSLNAAITLSDIEVGGIAVSALAPFETRRVAVPVTVPAGVVPGTYRLGWLIDPEGQLAELGEDNNSGLLAAPVTVGTVPDLVAEGLTLGAADWAAGQVVAVSWTVRNAGTATAGASVTGLYASDDATVTAADRLLLALDVPPLPAGGQAVLSGSVTVPADLAGQGLRVAALADTGGAVAEADEANASAAAVVAVSGAGAMLLGTDWPDAIAGTPGDDLVHGWNGADTLVGGGGADTLMGGSDDDALYGEDGADRLVGEYGFDTLLGNAGPDTLLGDIDEAGGQGDVLFGGAGDDLLIGHGGPDTLYGEDGDDRLEGGTDFDQLNGNGGDDTLLGGDTRDTLIGEAGRDSLNGEGGDDELWGGAEADTHFGGPGADFLDGGDGPDRLDGGAGADILLGGAGADTMTGDDAYDHMLGGPGADSMVGGAGDDQIFGEDDGDTATGDAGDDLIFGNGGDDLLDGGSGQDSLVGEAGADTIFGGSGDDLLVGNDGADSLAGGDGADLVDGGGDDDRLDGGPGDDAVYGRGGADRVAAGAGDDFAAGGEGDDTIIGGPGADSLGGDGGVDRFEFSAGDGADLIFDLMPGVETVAVTGGATEFGALVIGSSPEGWATVAYSADPGDVLTLMGVPPWVLADDGTFVFP